MNIVCTCVYAAIIAASCIGYSNSGRLNIGKWLYAMLVLFGANVAYCIYMVMVEMRKRKKMLELMTAGDRSVGFALCTLLQSEFRGFGLQLRSYRGTLG